MRLAGSNAREMSLKISDIDIFFKSDLTKDIEQDVYNIVYDFELKYDCLIDIISLRFHRQDTCGILANLPQYSS